MITDIALVRAPPGSVAAEQALQAVSGNLGPHRHWAVFFHAHGVDHGAAESGLAWAALADTARQSDHEAGRAIPQYGLDLQICETSWQRRRQSPVVAPFSAASLATLYSAIAGTGAGAHGGHARVASFGLSDRVSTVSPATGQPGSGWTRDLLIEIEFAPRQPWDRIEALEIALGAAAMEMTTCVVFRNDGVAHLEGSQARGWRQLTDFGLAELFVEGDHPATGSGAVLERLATPEVEQLRAQTRTMLVL